MFLDASSWVDLDMVAVQCKAKKLAQVAEYPFCHASNPTAQHGVDDELNVGLGNVSRCHFTNEGENVSLKRPKGLAAPVLALLKVCALPKFKQAPDGDSGVFGR